MEHKILILTFIDEGGKKRRMQIRRPKANLDGNTAKAGAQAIVSAGVFSEKGKFIAPYKAEIVVTTGDTLFTENE